MGLCLRESSSGKLLVFALDSNASNLLELAVFKYTDESTFSANYLAHTPVLPSSPMFMRIKDDGTNRISQYSTDGQHWITMHSVGRTDFLTPNEAGFLIGSSDNTWDCGMTLLSWSEA